MITTRQHQTTLLTLENAAQAARSGFACLFSSSDEFEAALIAERRAQGRYTRPNHWPRVLFIGGVFLTAAIVLLAG